MSLHTLKLGLTLVTLWQLPKSSLTREIDYKGPAEPNPQSIQLFSNISSEVLLTPREVIVAGPVSRMGIFGDRLEIVRY